MRRHPLARMLAWMLAGLAAGASAAAPGQIAPAFALPTAEGDVVSLGNEMQQKDRPDEHEAGLEDRMKALLAAAKG